MVTIKSLTSMLVLYINIKYTVAKNMSTFKAEDRADSTGSWIMTVC